ncbi:hypothetical protein AM1_C0208 (plasmid) [Acaryochloris marina MBIC11017]|uniref:Uncharacterized protein n=1 Tax=Acaryochloris marina (strain MBIC 11017) TaxID=329726 RepID=A8ZMU5_ACAM1|nr:hypothetical protein AM1_C0208 [Acaryochloris marina MBIC11017]
MQQVCGETVKVDAIERQSKGFEVLPKYNGPQNLDRCLSSGSFKK